MKPLISYRDLPKCQEKPLPPHVSMLAHLKLSVKMERVLHSKSMSDTPRTTWGASFWTVGRTGDMSTVLVFRLALQTESIVIEFLFSRLDSSCCCLLFVVFQELCQVIQQPDVKVLKNYMKVGLFWPRSSLTAHCCHRSACDCLLSVQAFFQRAKL